MRRERSAVVMNVAEQLWEAERANDIAMANTARLLASALDARLRLKMGACVGQAAVEALAATIDQQSASRRSLLQAHSVLNEIKGIAGHAEENFGGGGDKEVPKFASAVATPLRRVA